VKSEKFLLVAPLCKSEQSSSGFRFKKVKVKNTTALKNNEK
jgi:hypothetical protein